MTEASRFQAFLSGFNEALAPPGAIFMPFLCRVSYRSLSNARDEPWSNGQYHDNTGLFRTRHRAPLLLSGFLHIRPSN